MPDVSYHCSVYQGFNFKKDIQDHVGHITSLKIGDEEISADLNVTDPINVSETVKVVGVLNSIQWSTGYAEPISMGFQISTENKSKLAAMLHTSLANTEVEFDFNVYEYDPQEKMYFKCFHAEDTALTGLIFNRGGDLDIHVSTDQSGEVESPKNFYMSIGVMPQDTSQSLHMAVSNTDKFVKQWGIAVEA